MSLTSIPHPLKYELKKVKKERNQRRIQGMERKIRQVNHFSLLGPLMFFILSGCSLFTERRPIGEDTRPEDDRKVSRVQYDQLLKKYELLLKEQRKRDDVNKAVPAEEPALAKENKTHAGSELTETVNVLTGEQAANHTAGRDENHEGGPGVEAVLLPEISHPDKFMLGDQKLEEEIQKLDEGRKVLLKGLFPEALKILQGLENSEYKQIKVRAKFTIGELLMKQKEFDLSLQIFEDILQNYAFSGVVIKTLGHLITCSQKLKLEKKERTYTSMLKDFFQEG